MSVIKCTDEQMDRFIAAVEKMKRFRADQMPDEQAALQVMFSAWERLKELGWREAMYCPKDGTAFDAIEAGSTGIHTCFYEGEWPDGHWWIAEAGDLWPARPILFRAKKEGVSAGIPAGERVN